MGVFFLSPCLQVEFLLGSEGLDSVDLPFLEDRNPLESLLGTVEHQFGAQGVS